MREHLLRFASPLAAIPKEDELTVEDTSVDPLEVEIAKEAVPLPEDDDDDDDLLEVRLNEGENREPDYAALDDIMRHLTENPDLGVHEGNQPRVSMGRPRSPGRRRASLTGAASTSPLHMPVYGVLSGVLSSDAPGPSPRQYRHFSFDGEQALNTTELEDPFVDPPQTTFPSPVHKPNGDGDGDGSVPASEWDGAFSEYEHSKLESRVKFFDHHVNDLVDGLLASRLQPVEEMLDHIRYVLGNMNKGASSGRQDRRSISAEVQESDADDEDEEEQQQPVTRRSMSPRRDRRMEQIRAAVLDAFATAQRNAVPAVQAPPQTPTEVTPPATVDQSAVLKLLDELKELSGLFRKDDLRTVLEDVVQESISASRQDAAGEAVHKLEARVLDLEEQLRCRQASGEHEIAARRAAEDRAADLKRRLESAETRIEVEMMNKSIFDQRVADLEDRLHHQEAKVEEEWHGRRSAEDRLSEVQRLLRISSEEETRLREAVEQREQKIKSLEAAHAKSTMRLTLLEAGQTNAQQTQTESQNRINVLEADLRDARREVRHWRGEVDRLTDTSRRHEDDLSEALNENKAMHKLIETLGMQLEETERTREQWRAKFVVLQEEMTHAAHQVAEENTRRAKREQTLLARQEVLDAKLQAEARTRERIETELERLEMGERQGMRAVAECKRLETLLSELRSENHKLQQSALRYQAEFQEARESGAREVQRTRDSMQAEIEGANNQVNVVREELEDQIARLRAQLDQVKLDADTAKARHEMLLEEAHASKAAGLQELSRKHQNDMEDMQAHYERQLGNTTEDAQRAERNLLERLSISTSKAEFLQGQVAHLEERLEIARAAAHAAAQAAKSKSSSSSSSSSSVLSSTEKAAAISMSAGTAPETVVVVKTASHHLALPEKISPQALRESIAALQEQLQQREQIIEDLEQTVAKMDPEAETKISKRDEEIVWLRELLAVRHSDLHDIITCLGREDFDRNAVKDAAIRLKANLQMEEQERVRAMNGGSAISLPSLAATLRDATPRVAQAVGPLAAAWGNWRKSTLGASSGPGGNNNNNNNNTSGALGSSISSALTSSPAPPSNGSNTTTPAKSSSSASRGRGGNLFRGGLLTPPASGLRQQTPPTSTQGGQQQQPTAFASTGRRFTTEDLGNRPRPSMPQVTAAQDSVQVGRLALQKSPSVPVPVPETPSSKGRAFDLDARVQDFDDAGFFDDE